MTHPHKFTDEEIIRQLTLWAATRPRTKIAQLILELISRIQTGELL